METLKNNHSVGEGNHTSTLLGSVPGTFEFNWKKTLTGEKAYKFFDINIFIFTRTEAFTENKWGHKEAVKLRVGVGGRGVCIPF